MRCAAFQAVGNDVFGKSVVVNEEDGAADGVVLGHCKAVRRCEARIAKLEDLILHQAHADKPTFIDIFNKFSGSPPKRL
jgi:hypothetical protein